MTKPGAFLSRRAAACVAFTAALGLAAFACDDSTADKPTDYGPLLQTLTEKVVLPGMATLTARADELVTATAALEATPTADTLGQAQAAWRAARVAYRTLDVVHIGPIEDLGIASRIDLSPARPADIEAIVAATTPVDDGAVAAAGGKSKGFLGLEYLLFSRSGDAQALTSLQGDGAVRRRQLASAVAREIASSSHQLADAWDPARGGYASEVVNAGKSSARYPSQRAALDDYVGGVGYALELVVGIRLAMPLGRKSGGTPDPALDPTLASDSAVADMTATLDGFHVLYTTGGLSAQITTRSVPLDTQVASELTDCRTRAAGIMRPFATTVVSDTADVTSTYDSCKSLKGTWNTAATSALGATLKPADTDGD